MSLFEKVVVVLALNSQGFDVKMKHVDAGLYAAFQRLSGMSIVQCLQHRSTLQSGCLKQSGFVHAPWP